MQEDNTSGTGSPQGLRSLSPTSGSAAWGSCARKMSPRTAGFKGQQDCCKKHKRANRDSTLKGLELNLTCSKPQCRGSDALLDPEAPPERQEVIGTPFGKVDDSR